jgi:DNA polymerase I-like protein with 3'-5' exonuclease and polymerase domains
VTHARTFADHVVAYAQAGWPCVLPVPPETKTPPPVGFTGAEGRDTDPVTLTLWATGDYARHSIALRMPEHVIGIDVDQYPKGGVQKRGAETLAYYLERWGPLPPTWTSTARDDAASPVRGPSRIHFFRVPAQRYATRLATPETGDVEIIQRHHRYAVVWPSVHAGIDTGAGPAIYRWYDPAGVAVDAPPKPSELPALPSSWVQGLSEGAAAAGPAMAAYGAGEQLLTQLREDIRPECAEITSARMRAIEDLSRADAGSRHDTMTERSHHLIQLAAAGHTGVGAALAGLAELWSQITAGEERTDELERAFLTSARKAVTAVGPVQVPRDPCLFMVGGAPLPHPLPPGGAPVDPETGEPVDLEIVAPPRWHGVREVIGTAAFDPNAGLDQTLAEAVLARTYPALRYAYDSGGWLLRAPDRWELYKRLSPWAVAAVAPLMPIGDPTAEKGSDPFERSKRRARLMTAAGAGAVAKMMDALVSAGMHPAAVSLAELDAEPDVLWAGGMPYALRASAAGPAFAEHIDPTTPHLHTAGVVPELRPTPLWDAFTAAVWPDPEVRAWSLRVLSISATGYADRALPLLLGETGRGKTQVIHLLMSLLGTYAHAADSRLISPAGDRAHASIVFALKGRRLSFIDEAPRDSRDAQERLKQLTGGGELTANAMNQNPITFRPSHTLVLTANPESEPTLTDPAVRSRVRLIPCEGDPEEVRRTRAAIGHVKSTAWRTEAPGVLAKLMAEAAGWLADPGTAQTAAAPEEIRYLAERLGAEQDPVMAWLEEETEPFEEGTPSRELYQAFTASCRRNNLRRDLVPSETKWGRTLTRIGYEAVPTRSGNRRRLRIRTGGGFLPGSGPTPAQFMGATEPAKSDMPGMPERGGLDSTGGGLVDGSNPNPPHTKPQVNPRSSVDAWRVGGFETCTTHTHAPAHAHETPMQELPQPSTRSVGEQAPIPGLTCENGSSEPPSEPSTQTLHREPAPEKPRAKKPPDPEKAAAAREKRAAVAAEKRAAAIAEAAGAEVQLPAVLTRDAAIRPCSAADADALLGTLTVNSGELTIDVENTGYPVGHSDYELRTVQLGGEHFAIDLDPHDPEQAEVVRRHLAAASSLHAHSATADLVPVVDAGLADEGEVWAKMLDTAILAKLADPSSTGNDADLKGLAKNALGEYAASTAADEARAALFKAGKWLTDTKVTTPVERSGWAQVDPRCSTMVRYAASDVLDCAALARTLPRPAPEILERERIAQRMVARVSHHGIRIDGAHVEALTGPQTEALEDASRRLREFGVENPGSDQQVAARAEQLGAQLPRTKTGRPSVAAGALEPLAELDTDLGAFVRARLDYQKAETAIGLFLNPYRELYRRGDGRVRPTVYTLGADTGRMSCVRLNLQQLPREGGFRQMLTADPGELLISADFASVELRVAAALSGDTELLRMILEADADPGGRKDLHWQIARLVWGPNATKAHRYKAKPMVFGRIYGSGVDGLARSNGVSHDVAKAVINAMDMLTPGLSEWSRMVRDAVEAGRTQFQTYSGRIVHLDKDRPHAAPNYCIQGTARELLVDGLIRWNRTRWGGAVLWPVHDEIDAKVPEDEAEEASATLVEVMTSEISGVPIVVEPSAPAFAWQDAA